MVTHASMVLSSWCCLHFSFGNFPTDLMSNSYVAYQTWSEGGGEHRRWMEQPLIHALHCDSCRQCDMRYWFRTFVPTFLNIGISLKNEWHSMASMPMCLCRSRWRVDQISMRTCSTPARFSNASTLFPHWFLSVAAHICDPRLPHQC